MFKVVRIRRVYSCCVLILFAVLLQLLTTPTISPTSQLQIPLAILAIKISRTRAWLAQSSLLIATILAHNYRPSNTKFIGASAGSSHQTGCLLSSLSHSCSTRFRLFLQCTHTHPSRIVSLVISIVTLLQASVSPEMTVSRCLRHT